MNYRQAESSDQFQGNSVGHWYDKAHAYSGIVFEVCEAFRLLGYQGEFGNLHTLSQRLHEYVRILKTSAMLAERGKNEQAD